MSSIYEIAINQSKEGQHENFLSTRQKFVEVLGKEDATINEGKWNPFFTVAPGIDLSRVCWFYTQPAENQQIIA